MKNKFALLILSLIAGWSPHSASAFLLKSDCALAHLSSLTYQAPGAPAAEEWCNEMTPLPEEMSKVLSQIADLNHLAAQAINLPDGDLPFSFQLKIGRTDMGPLDSYANEGIIFLGIMKDAKPNQINAGIYLHEIGHLLSLSKSPLVPARLKTFVKSPLTVELVADLLSLSIENTILSTDNQELPGCLDRTRYMTNFQTFQYPIGFFTSDYSIRRVIACCSSKLWGTVLAHGKSLPPIPESWQTSCDSKLKEWDNGKAFSKFNARGRLNPDTVMPNLTTEDGLALDPHQLGLPINSFLSDFAKRQGLKLSDLFKTLLTLSDNQSKPMVCTLNGKSGIKAEFQRSTVQGILQTYRNSLDTLSQANFDAEWTKHSLSTLSFLEGGILNEDDETLAVAQIAQKAKATRNACKGKVHLSFNGTSETCGVNCQ